MSDLNDFLKVIAEAKAADPNHQRIKEVKEHVKSDLGSLFQQLGAVKAADPKEKLIKEVKEHVAEDIAALFSSLQASITPEKLEKIDELVEEVKQIEEELIVEVTPIEEPKTPEEAQQGVEKYLKALPKDSHSFQQPLPQITAKDLTAITNKLKFLEQWVGKISAAGPGGGEVNLRWLDDVARETIADGRWLKYDGERKKFVFDEINPYEVVYNTTEVTTSTYTVQDNDYYIGVNYAGPVTITLPSSANSGRMLIIKDEDGDAEINPITCVGTVDNDTGGFIIQINNGGVQLLYRNGWRIV
jgi:hypothetical protein